MRITRIDPILIRVPFSYGLENGVGGRLGLRTIDTLFVRVETDEGAIGWGEGYGFGAAPSTGAALQSLVAPLCIGRDPADVRGLASELQRKLHNYGLDGPVLYALSGVEIALWDIAGKLAGLPLYELLGGAARRELPVYASLLRYGDAAVAARNVEAALARGYRQIKLHEVDCEVVAASRHAAGKDVSILLDVNCSWGAAEAVEMAERLQAYDIGWLEEPVWPPNDIGALAWVNARSPIPVAAGENATTLVEFREMFRLGAAAYAQPSVTKAGGIGALLEIAGLAEAHGVELRPHSPYLGPGFVATVHILAAIGGDRAIERYYVDLEASPIADSIRVSGGMIGVPQAPGLGLRIDEEVMARYRIT